MREQIRSAERWVYISGLSSSMLFAMGHDTDIPDRTIVELDGVSVEVRREPVCCGST